MSRPRHRCRGVREIPWELLNWGWSHFRDHGGARESGRRRGPKSGRWSQRSHWCGSCLARWHAINRDAGGSDFDGQFDDRLWLDVQPCIRWRRRYRRRRRGVLGLHSSRRWIRGVPVGRCQRCKLSITREGMLRRGRAVALRQLHRRDLSLVSILHPGGLRCGRTLQRLRLVSIGSNLCCRWDVRSQMPARRRNVHRGNELRNSHLVLQSGHRRRLPLAHRGAHGDWRLRNASWF